MVYMIKYQNRKKAADPHDFSTESFFAEHPTEPTDGMVTRLVDQVSGGDFEKETIAVKEQPECDAEKLKKQTRVYTFV